MITFESLKARKVVIFHNLCFFDNDNFHAPLSLALTRFITLVPGPFVYITRMFRWNVSGGVARLNVFNSFRFKVCLCCSGGRHIFFASGWI